MVRCAALPPACLPVPKSTYRMVRSNLSAVLPHDGNVGRPFRRVHGNGVLAPIPARTSLRDVAGITESASFAKKTSFHGLGLVISLIHLFRSPMKVFFTDLKRSMPPLKQHACLIEKSIYISLYQIDKLLSIRSGCRIDAFFLSGLRKLQVRRASGRLRCAADPKFPILDRLPRIFNLSSFLQMDYQRTIMPYMSTTIVHMELPELPKPN